MMVGALLTSCDCKVCDENIPELPPEYTKLYKGFTAQTTLFYANINTITGETAPLFSSQTFTSANLQCINPSPLFGSAYTLDARNALKLDPDFLNWPWGFSSPDSPELITLDVNSFTTFEIEWNLTGNTFENTTGGIRRANQNQVLLTGGVPIKRKVYDFTATTPTALNNTPAFSLDVYEEKRCCCEGGTTNVDYTCPTKSFASVEPGPNQSGSIPFNTSEYETLKLKYVGRTNATAVAFTVNLANNAANNARTWQAIVAGGQINFVSSDGNSTGFLSGSLTSVANTLALNTSWFSSVSLNSFLLLESGVTVANTSDLPNWSSFPIQRGINGTSIQVPLAFRGELAAPSTYDCGFYTESGNAFFGTDFENNVGTFSYTNDEQGFLNYLTTQRKPEHISGFVECDSQRGLYYRREFDQWLQNADTNGWNLTQFIPTNSTQLKSFEIPFLGFTLETFELLYNKCYIVGNEPETGIPCYSGQLTGVVPFCPPDDYWNSEVGDLMLMPGSGFPGINNCFGTTILNCPPCGSFCPGTDVCVCGSGSGTTGGYSATNRNATQILSGTWQLTS